MQFVRFLFSTGRFVLLSLYRSFSSEIIGVYLGEHRVNNSKTERLTSLGVVSGDLVMVRIETNGIPELDATGTQQQPMDISVLEPSSSVNDRPIIEKADESLDVDRIPDVLHERMLSMGFQVRFNCLYYRNLLSA